MGNIAGYPIDFHSSILDWFFQYMLEIMIKFPLDAFPCFNPIPIFSFEPKDLIKSTILDG